MPTHERSLNFLSWYLGSVLLEKNRWRHLEPPALKLSQFAGALRNSGFEQIELWEFHYLKADDEERRQLRDGPLSFPVFNTYAQFKEGDEYAQRLEQVRAAVLDIGSAAIKFNVPKEPELLDAALGLAKDWIATFPAHVRLYCECHPGTALEERQAAAQAFADLPEDRFAAIVHTMSSSADQVQSWFDALGHRIVHMHIQTRNEQGKFCPASDQSERARQTFDTLLHCGFVGTATFEFTTGCATPTETPEALLQSVEADRRFIKELWQPYH